MLGFYVGMGVLLALAAGFYLAWTPARVCWHRRQVLEAPSGNAAQWRAVRDTARLGPASETVVRELLAHPDTGVRLSACRGLHLAGQAWSVPLLVAAAGDSNPEVAGCAIAAAAGIADIAPLNAAVNAPRGFGRPLVMLLPEKGEPLVQLPLVADRREVESLRLRLMDWWEREGRARYGGKAE
jgi:hypothetical protein